MARWRAGITTGDPSEAPTEAGPSDPAFPSPPNPPQHFSFSAVTPFPLEGPVEDAVLPLLPLLIPGKPLERRQLQMPIQGFDALMTPAPENDNASEGSQPDSVLQPDPGQAVIG